MQVIVVGGFLGSGKTTTIINMGKYLADKGKKVAIIVNEIGEIGIDGDVIDRFGFDSKEITNGCICCTLKVSMKTTVTLLAKEYKPDILLVEPTGIAFPHVIKEDIELMNLGESVTVAPLVTLIDGSRFKHMMKEVKNFSMRQIIDAEILGINKVDLIEPIRVPILEASVQQLNPKAKVVQLSGKAMDERFEGLMQMLLPEFAGEKPAEMEKPPEEEKAPTEKVPAKEVTKASAAPGEIESSIEASGVGSYAVEFAVEKQDINREVSREITTELMKRIKTKVLNLNPEFIGHIKLFLDNGTETVKQSVTIYSEEPQEDIVNSKPDAKPSLKVLSAVSNVKTEKLFDAVNSSVQEIFEKKEISIRKIEHAHEHGHNHGEHEHEEHHEHEHHEH
ncbi:GTP-binding protein [Methanosarcina sp. MTP4]|uniref:GTP-binding protein n=1 Tax=Methanosarcina sp. MTP4 TaxID=1434100 RepID=UPI00064E89AB|nr:GTP-binding protein [Methanosarcina sp. MTP4]